MPQTNNINRRIVLAARPHGAPTAETFRLEETVIPTPATGQLLLRTIHLSLDPYMRGRMSDAPSYAPPVAVNEVMGAGTVARVVASFHSDYKVGDLVLSYSGWQDYSVSDGSGLIKLDSSLIKPSHALGVMGMPGFTAYVGLLDIGQPKAGETVVVAAATGAVGSLVGQIAKLKGCHVIGIAGGVEKCKYAVEELGFDVCLDHRSSDFPQQLKAACPKGIDVYFENVGGAVFDAVLPLLNLFARVPVCGLIANYNATELPKGPDRLALLARTVLTRSLKIQGFINSNYPERHDAFLREMSDWLKTGKIKYREEFVEGLENAPQAFIGLLEGKNFGKLIIDVAE
ncbi:NADP-dependent oxidoreductase [Glaciimonas immobilis]|uniref:Enoyl reductase (ER) domain-containing protein n=1 Tax=Glaciimonas immobilis TaxID=728004 RepID=A0A840RQK4_9BURK|nr:NADP-dependent oxidoreductase [Glaciimonas immobilis]KAF3998045.1 NADP-dependent oxidoreductase [Glaciimonas immobilis]MBB5199268.1 hypothetical protein [Glaciimonas immobilis]